MAGARRNIGYRRFSSRGPQRLSDAQRKAMFANIQAHQGLVRRVVSSQMHRIGPRSHISREDLISAGNLGLTEFARRFNVKRGVKFTTGAHQAITSRVLKEIQKTTVRVPEKAIKKVAAKGALPTTHELSPLHAQEGNGLLAAEHRADVAKLLKKLSPTERKVVTLRHLQGHTLGVVAKRMKVSGVRIKKIEAGAMKKLKGFARAA